MDAAHAHQRLIREERERADPRPVPSSLKGYTVAEVPRAAAIDIISEYEWLGTIGRASIHIGLVAPDGDVHGVACFGYGPPSPIRKMRIGEPALCLERGACVHYAPRNAASFLISRACKLVYRYSGIARFFAYCDPEAGEYGGVYQACGWLYLGQGLQNKNNRPTRTAVLHPRDKDEASDHTKWHSTRLLRDYGFRKCETCQGKRRQPPCPDCGGVSVYQRAEAAGWTVLRESHPEAKAGKYVYATNVGSDRQQWFETVPHHPYPAPRPLLKLSPENAL